MTMSDVDTIALEATHQIENEFARSRNGGRVQRRAAVQIIVANAIHAVSPPEPTEAQVEAGGWALCADAQGAGKGKCSPDCRCFTDSRIAVTAALRAMPLHDAALPQNKHHG